MTLATKSSKLIVTKSNALIQASYRLTLNEQRLVLACISKLDGRKPLPRDNMFKITADDFSEIFNTSTKHAYEILSEATDTLYQRDIKTSDGRSRERIRWVYHIKYFDGEGRVELGFSPTIAPYLSLLHKQFTSYNLKRIADLNSSYSIRMFEMLSQFEETGLLIITVDDLKERLALEGRYPRFYDFNRRVIQPAIKELKEKSGLVIECEQKKKGRMVVSLVFRFHSDEQMQLDV